MRKLSPGCIAGIAASYAVFCLVASKWWFLDKTYVSQLRRGSAKTDFLLLLSYAAIFLCCSLFLRNRKSLKPLKFKKIKAFVKIFAALAVCVILIVPAVDEEKYHWEPLLAGLDYVHHYEKASDYYEYRAEMDEVLTVVRDDMKSEGLTGFAGITRNFSRSYNEAIGLNYRSMAHYSSAFNRKVNEFLGHFGYSCAYLWNLDFGATAVTDSIFGMKYLLNGNLIWMWDEDRLIEVGSTAPPSEYTKIGNVEGVFETQIYRNDFAVDGPFIMSGDASGADFKGNYFSNQNKLIKLCSGIDADVFKQVGTDHVTLTTSPHVSQKPDEPDKYTGAGGFLEYSVELTDGGVLYAYFQSGGSQGNPKLFVHLDGNITDPIFLFRGETNCVQRLGSARPDGKVTFSIEVSKTVDTSGFMFYVLDTDALKLHTDAIKAKSLNITKFGSGYIKGELGSAAQDGGTMLIQVAYDPGWTVKADGKKVKTGALADGLLTAEIPAGTKSVVLVYRARGQVAGIALSCAALLFCACMIAVKIIKKRRLAAQAKAVPEVRPVDFQ